MPKRKLFFSWKHQEAPKIMILEEFKLQDEDEEPEEDEEDEEE